MGFDVEEGIGMKYTIINPKKEFRRIKLITLNRQGEKKGTRIGEIVVYRNKLFYITFRDASTFMKKHSGFGIDKGILERILKEEVDFKKIFKEDAFVLYVIFHYRGEKEKRYFCVDPMDIEEEGIEETYTKEFDDCIETYGTQYFIPTQKMKVIGYDWDDYEVQQAKQEGKL